MLANTGKFGVTGDTSNALASDAREKAETFKKSAFALRYAIDDTDWKIPTYISDGLNWLSAGIVAPVETATPPVEAVAVPGAAEEPAHD